MTTSTTPTNLINASNCGNHCSNQELQDLAKSLTRAQPVGLLIISTKFYGPTNTKGSRIKATINGTPVTKTVGYDHGLNTLDNHAYAALFLLSSWFEGESLQYQGHDETEDGKGWAYVFKFV
jgi:hypothetical protein